MIIDSQRTGKLRSRKVLPRKVLGQHFLVDDAIAHKIVEAADLSPDDTVLEIGPGYGMLTAELIKKGCRVVAVEIDSHLGETLPGRLRNPDSLRVITADARVIDLGEVLDTSCNYKMVANLPYYAANPIIRRFLETSVKPSVIVIMVQKEVAESMIACPGRMTILSVAVQLYSVPSVVCQVPNSAFRPRPKVSSTVLRLDVLPDLAVPIEDVDDFFSLVRAGFAAPRKQLRNSLRQGLKGSAHDAEELLRTVDIDSHLRAESLSLEDWRKLYCAYISE